MKRVILGVALAALAAALAAAVIPSSSARPLANTWAGTWSTNFGTMTLRQSGNSVDGNYTHDQGHLRGTVSGRVLRGKWDEAPTRTGPGDAGDFEFTMSADGKSWTGRWRYAREGAPWGTDWRGTCTRGACAGTPQADYTLLLWTNKPDGRMHSQATRMNRVNRGGDAGINLTVRMPQGTPPPPFKVWFEQRPPGVAFGNGSLGDLVVCTNLSTTRHCRLHSPGYGVSGSSLQAFFITPVRHQGRWLDMPITRFFRVTGRDSQGRLIVASNALRVTWTEAD